MVDHESREYLFCEVLAIAFAVVTINKVLEKEEADGGTRYESTQSPVRGAGRGKRKRGTRPRQEVGEVNAPHEQNIAKYLHRCTYPS